ncbi:SLATT domain-containing protein [Pseudomonas izuensis]|uniref:DUF4231 domain-containing protein n=1 Tax=Pseudomonas izuensis TaxID=2684212 RepID=A0ABM7RR72_9PSED|nr:SLATT domain-containing protein [Pseudomonas izuensis]BCX67955.1 DUF4231 domain-containing protein [Pseudomonas izuensis]
MVKNLFSTAEDYRHYAQKKSNAHYRMSEKAKSKHNFLGIPVAASTTIVGTTIFTTLNSTSQNLYVQIGIGLLSLSAAVLAALQTFFNFGDVATQHKQAAASYEAVRHELDIFLLRHGALCEDEPLDAPLKELREIAAELDDIVKKAPSVPDSVYDSAQTRVATRPIHRL